jgi:hypothetical protein
MPGPGSGGPDAKVVGPDAKDVATSYDNYSTVKSIGFGTVTAGSCAQNLQLLLKLRDAPPDQLMFGIAHQDRSAVKQLLTANVVFSILALTLTVVLVGVGAIRPNVKDDVNQKELKLNMQHAVASVQQLGWGFKVVNGLAMALGFGVLITQLAAAAYFSTAQGASALAPK